MTKPFRKLTLTEINLIKKEEESVDNTQSEDDSE